MSISNINDRATVDAVRGIDKRVARIEYQLSSFIKNNSLTAYHSALLGLDFATSSHTGFASSSGLTAHTGDATIHFLQAAIDHVNILSIGTNTHAVIDTHIADGTIHFASGAGWSVDGGEAGTSVRGSFIGFNGGEAG